MYHIWYLDGVYCLIHVPLPSYDLWGVVPRYGGYPITGYVYLLVIVLSYDLCAVVPGALLVVHCLMHTIQYPSTGYILLGRYSIRGTYIWCMVR